jgi:signal transduction histidine kinase
MVPGIDRLQSSTPFADNKLFDGITPEVLAEIGAGVEPVRFRSGEVIFREGEVGACMFLVGKGRVKISKLGRGGQQETLGFIESGSFFGEMALLDGEPRSAQATAVEPTLLGAVDEPAFQTILRLAPTSLHLNFLRSVAGRLRHVNNYFITEVMRSERLSLVGGMANSIIHDLRTPICAILCCADLIASKSTDASVIEYTDIIKKSVDGMTDMTQELLDFARGKTSLQFKEMPLSKLLEDLDMRMMRMLPPCVHLFKEIHCNPMLNVDLGRFARVLLNLIRNSIEAMHGGGVLRIGATAEGELLSLTVSDTGCGIPPELLPHIFEPFVTSGKPNGTGLGMAIAKSVVEAHGGSISVTSKVGTGTTMQILIPIIAWDCDRSGYPQDGD